MLNEFTVRIVDVFVYGRDPIYLMHKIFVDRAIEYERYARLDDVISRGCLLLMNNSKMLLQALLFE